MAKNEQGGSQETTKSKDGEGNGTGTAVLDKPSTTPGDNPSTTPSTTPGDKGADKPSTTPGDNDRAVTTSANPSGARQVTQSAPVKKAEGQKIREAARKAEEKRGVVTLASAMYSPDGKSVVYDETGMLVNGDGKKIALAADATDLDVGWTVQNAGSHLDEKDRLHYPGGPATVPDQTVHPDELPDPLAAIQCGLLPQNAAVLNIDSAKFDGKKSLEA